jgi:hypothetical protein
MTVLSTFGTSIKKMSHGVVDKLFIAHFADRVAEKASERDEQALETYLLLRKQSIKAQCAKIFDLFMQLIGHVLLSVVYLAGFCYWFIFFFFFLSVGLLFWETIVNMRYVCLWKRTGVFYNQSVIPNLFIAYAPDVTELFYGSSCGNFSLLKTLLYGMSFVAYDVLHLFYVMMKIAEHFFYYWVF